MTNIKVISKQIFGECSGSIFIDLVHAASEIILTPDILHDFTCELYRRLYSNEQWESMIICLDDSSYFFNDLNANLMTANPKWFQIYRENDYVFCDQVKIEDEDKEETIAEDVCINEAFDIMRKEIDDNMTDCQFRVKAYQEVYDCLEHYKQSFFFIVDEEKSCWVRFETFDMEKYYAKYSISYINEEFTIKKYTKGDQK